VRSPPQSRQTSVYSPGSPASSRNGVDPIFAPAGRMEFWPPGSWKNMNQLQSSVGQDRQRNRAIGEKYEQGRQLGKSIDDFAVGSAFPSHRLEHTAHAMTQVQAEQPEAKHVKTGYPEIRKPGNHHPINVMASLFIFEQSEIFSQQIDLLALDGEMQQMVDNEDGDNDAAHQHGPRGMTGRHHLVVRVGNGAG